MIIWLLIFGTLYIGALAYSTYKSQRAIKHPKDYTLPQIGSFLGFLTFSATLFSTFTLMGMPDFFRTHGVGAWIFLGVTDTALAFVLLWFGFALRKRYSKENFTNVSSIIKERYGNSMAVYTYRLGIFIFLIPYVAIQIKGVAEFIDYSAILNIPSWGWSVIFLVIILIYSYFGGLKAIIISDAIQGLLLLLVTIIIAYTCTQSVGGVADMFKQISISNPKLLSTPGPKNLLTSQFLLASFIVIILMPISQPQLLTRIIIMKKLKNVKRMAIAVSVFAFLIILPTIFIGFYGAIKFPTAPMQEFLFNALVQKQSGIIGALAIIGLISATMSTADSQLFAIQSEVTHEHTSKWQKKLFIVFFGLIALLLSIYSTKELVLLARVSFAGTALLAPMIFVSVFAKNKQTNILPIITLISLVLYLLSNLSHFVPNMVFGLRADLFLLAINTLAAIITYSITNKKSSANC